MIELEDYRSNPGTTVYGEDLKEAAELAVGIAGSGYVADKLLTPVLGGVVGGPLHADNLMGQVVNVVTTFAAGLVGSEALRLFGMNRFARNFRKGGAIFASAKAISIPIKNFQLSSTFPDIPGISAIAARFSPPPPPEKALANGTAAAIPAMSVSTSAVF